MQLSGLTKKGTDTKIKSHRGMGQMLQDIPLVINLLFHTKKSKRFQGQTQAKVTKSMPVVYYNDGSCSHQKHHETRGVYYKHICSTCFAHEGKSSPPSAVECRQKNARKTNKPVYGFPLLPVLMLNGSRIINCRNKSTVSQYSAPSHVWKQWLTMSNMCRPVGPRRYFVVSLRFNTCGYLVALIYLDTSERLVGIAVLTWKDITFVWYVHVHSFRLVGLRDYLLKRCHQEHNSHLYTLWMSCMKNALS